MKNMLKLSGIIVVMAMFGACFSPWAGDPGYITINFGEYTPEEQAAVRSASARSASARSAVTPEEIPNLTHIITLYGNGAEVTERLIGAGTISISVLPGNWNIRIRAESPEQRLRALGFEQVRVVGRRQTSVEIDMISATEVTNHAQLAAAIGSARTDGLEKIIVVTQDIVAASQLTIATDRQIILASNSNVVIRRGAGFAPGNDIFVKQGSGTLTVGRAGFTGGVYVQGMPGLSPPAYFTRGLDIRGDVLYGRYYWAATNIVIPPTVRSIRDYAFDGDNLTGVTIPGSVESIGRRAFRNTNLTSVTITGTVHSIGFEAFTVNRVLTSVTIHYGVRYIEQGAFNGSYLTSVIIPNSVTYIGIGAFQNNSLEWVTISDRVQRIENWAFTYNYLTSVIIPNSVRYIGVAAFRGNRLTSVTIPAVRSIEAEAFQNNALNTITIGASVYIGDNFSMGVYGADFRAFYEGTNNQLGGTFVWANGSWSRQP
ncbi:MAG: leucine-rich repeat domain-containing protein [Treponema sp.]|jgi:hypothetical protein|nr:leucine-rich repeat domain-containing protein [Treponema sp.]